MPKPEPKLVKISELARLSDVASPTIKHYMREGLLPGPARRTSRNMAYYDARLADRVRTIKNLQQKHYLPLKLIGEILEPAPSSELRTDLDTETRARLAGITPGVQAGIERSRSRRKQTDVQRTRKDILSTGHITIADLAQLEDLGLSSPKKGKRGAKYYDGPDLDLIEVIIETRERGLEDLFPMSILEPYVTFVRTLVRMEIELFRQRVLEGAKLPPVPLDDIARDATDLGERMICAMRNKLVIPELQQIASPRKDS